MNPERGIDYDKIVRDEQNALRADDVRELNRLVSSNHISAGMQSEIDYLQGLLHEEQRRKDSPPKMDHEEKWLMNQALIKLRNKREQRT